DGDHRTLTLVSGNREDGNDTKQHCKSLPLYYDRICKNFDNKDFLLKTNKLKKCGIAYLDRNSICSIKKMSRTLLFATVAVLAASTLAATCTKPKITSTTFTTRDATIVSQIALIAEFSLKCSDSDADGLPLFAEINGRLTPVARIKDNKFQVSWTEDPSAGRGERVIRLFDEEGFGAVRKAQRAGQSTSSLKELAKISVYHSGAYSGPWINSEYLAAALATIVAYSELYTLGSRPGMECMPLRSPPGPYHYHVTDQTKSLQELQNEVGALLEFRDLVIETFPDLKHKMASISASNTITGIPSSSLASRRDWEPGIRVRRKLTQKENGEISSSLTRSRSNSHSGKKEPKSGEGNGSVVQDSGFSTETSSSKDTSSTTGAMTGPIGIQHPAHRTPIEVEDELWNLLDVIHRKSTRLREEVDHLQKLEREKFRNSGSSSGMSAMFHSQLDRLSKDDVHALRAERDRLLNKLSEMEAETRTGRLKVDMMQDELEALHSVKRDLEGQLKLALSQKIDINSRIHDMHQQFVSKSVPSSPESTKPRLFMPSSVRKLSTDSTTPTPILTTTSTATTHHPNNVQDTSTHQLISSRLSGATTFTPIKFASDNYDMFADAKHLKNELNLGRLDGLVSSPNRSCRVRVTDSRKIAAILLETNTVELQRHLLTLTVQNQVLTQRLEQATKSKIYLIKKLDKAKEDIDDLRFQLEERNIELEGTRAQMRVLESKHQHKSDYCSSSRDCTQLMQTQVSTPSMKAMIPLIMDEQHHNHNSSSTESAQDQTECDHRNAETPRKRPPSKIPLPGTKGYLAPKPPSGRNSITTRNSPSGPPSNRSLSKSTGSLVGRNSSPNSVTKKDDFTSITNRPESAQSIRKDSSLSNSGRSSSIPISSKTTPTRSNNSPIPKPKRDSLSQRTKNMDSLSRIQISGTSTPTSSTSNLYKTNSKKDLSSSFSTGQNRDKKSVVTPTRRLSSTSVGRGVVETAAIVEQDTGKTPFANNDIRMKLTPLLPQQPTIQNRNLIREYFTRTRLPPPIFKPSFTPFTPSPQLEIAYTHPARLLTDPTIMQPESVYNETNREIEIKYVDDNSVELLDAGCKISDQQIYSNEDSCNSRKEKQIAFQSFVVETPPTEEANLCKLIGKVSPNLVKTWEQLNDLSSNAKPNYLRSTSNESEKILYPEPTELVTGKPYEVNHVVHSGSSETFFDSIDGLQWFFDKFTF
ncbi:Translocon-associated protein subunit delta, partial [Pseudolycoriella hygida]